MLNRDEIKSYFKLENSHAKKELGQNFLCNQKTIDEIVSLLKLKELKMQDTSNFLFLEAMKAPVKKIKGKYRYQIVLRIIDKNILDNIYLIVDSMYNNNVYTFIEINPNNFM